MISLRRVATVAAAAALALTLAACTSEPRGGAARLPGDLPEGTSFASDAEAPAAPSLEGRLVDGTEVDLDVLAAGRPLIVQFMASWCSTCAGQQGVLADVASQYGDAVAIAQVSGDTDPEALATYLEDHQVGDPVVLDPDLQIWRAYAVTEPPMTALIDADGHLVKLWPGGADAVKIGEQLEQMVSRAG
ncbi:peroxiredoxin [Agromyces sp. 3263]|uniref:TlpA family protein disulfide reductase n=1 Tax=Agromyces sp. 3263 TaxID=2817750 RepID=UPI002864E1DD|nr:TlpA disulfide reductase family protein [Agromyces sp. 3263]MDR6907110.1 peroxiredoxin [Agromyces sp. 3263]